MPNIKETAQAYEPPQSQNISELEKIDINAEVKKDTALRKEDGTQFTYNFIEVDGIKYRVPDSVLGGIKAILERKPDTKHVSVIRSGTGMATKYQVIPMD